MKRLLKTAIATLITTNLAVAHAAETRISYVLPVQIPASWLSIDPIVSDWTESDDVYGCTNWSPSVDTVDYGVSFMQTATDCKKDSTRTITSRLKNNQTGEIRLGSTSTETKSTTVSQVRAATGEKVEAGEITSFTVTGGALVGANGKLSWGGKNIASYAIHSSSEDSGISTTAVSLGSSTEISFTPKAEGSYVYTLTATGLDGVEYSRSVELPVKDSSASGTMLLNAVEGGNQPYRAENDQPYKGTAYNLPAGKLSQIGLLIGNYSGQSNGTLNLTACGSGGCVSGSTAIRGTVDNSYAMIALNNALPVQQGENVEFTYTLTGANLGPAVWVYYVSKPIDGRSVSTFGGSGQYASMKLTYE